MKPEKKLKPEEKIAENYLKSLGLGHVDYEPIPNEPPDFLVGGKLAVEVRRLNENYFPPANGKTKGLEEDTIPLRKQIERVLAKYNNSSAGKRYLLALRCKRPLPQIKIESELTSSLQNVINHPPQTPFLITLGKDLSLELREIQPGTGPMFTFPLVFDADMGGMLTDICMKNIRHCIEEKAGKTAQNWSKYPEWRLLFIDYIGINLTQHEMTALKNDLRSVDPFVRVDVIDYSGKHIVSFP